MQGIKDGDPATQVLDVAAAVTPEYTALREVALFLPQPNILPPDSALGLFISVANAWQVLRHACIALSSSSKASRSRSANRMLWCKTVAGLCEQCTSVGSHAAAVAGGDRQPGSYTTWHDSAWHLR